MPPFSLTRGSAGPGAGQYPPVVAVLLLSLGWSVCLQPLAEAATTAAASSVATVRNTGLMNRATVRTRKRFS